MGEDYLCYDLVGMECSRGNGWRRRVQNEGSSDKAVIDKNGMKYVQER